MSKFCSGDIYYFVSEIFNLHNELKGMENDANELSIPYTSSGQNTSPLGRQNTEDLEIFWNYLKMRIHQYIGAFVYDLHYDKL
jgi:hypothetical protein